MTKKKTENDHLKKLFISKRLLLTIAKFDVKFFLNRLFKKVFIFTITLNR